MAAAQAFTTTPNSADNSLEDALSGFDDEEKQPDQPKPRRGFWRWVTGKVRPVPDDLAACEYSCRELECSQSRWKDCEHRIHYGTEHGKRTSEASPGSWTRSA